MPDFGEVLEGYAIPQLLPYEPDGKGGFEQRRPIGDTGLTARISHIVFLWPISETLRRRRFWYFGHVHLGPVFQPLQSSIEAAWMVEMLRILDKPRTKIGKTPRENLTVRLCHERFQTSAVPTAQQKADESKRYDELVDLYDKADLEAIRNRAMFHLDHEEHLLPPRPTGDISNLTGLLGDWLISVAHLHYKHQDMQGMIDRSRRRGQLVGRHYRRMMTMYYRAEIGEPTRRNLSPKNVEFFQYWRNSAQVPDERIT